MRNVESTIAALAVAVTLIAACASTPEAPLSKDADAKRFESATNAAIVYIYRPYADRGVSTLWVNGRLVGESLGRTFFRVPVRSGRTIINASGNDAGRIAFDAKLDGVYYVETQVSGELQSESNTVFRLVDPQLGMPAIETCCRLLENWRPSQDRLNF
ncbi:MAG: hypothetical protein JWN94_4423 [Betaproteobacteria bacterium]|nr:hypothetical protein [Betaproteobacteria bacterium]